MLQCTHMPSFVRHPGGLRDHPALVLNADFRPLSYLPLSLWPWQEAVKAAVLERVVVVAEYDAVVHSPSIEFRIPSVVVLKEYVKPARATAFTRFNLFLRDEFTQEGREIKTTVVTGINAGAQPYWNAESTMLMHTKGILDMTGLGDGAHRQAGARLLRRRLGRGQIRDRRLRPHHGTERPGPVLGPGPGGGL